MRLRVADSFDCHPRELKCSRWAMTHQQLLSGRLLGRTPYTPPLLQVDSTRQAQWQKLTRLSPADMEALLNLELLGVPIQPKPKLGLTLTRRRNRAYRKARDHASLRFVERCSGQ